MNVNESDFLDKKTIGGCINGRFTPRNNPPVDEVINPNIGVGIEIEAERVSNINRVFEYFNEGNVKYWDVKRDGSLRGQSLELVSGVISGAHILNALEIPEYVFRKFECSPKYTHRCSVHVHMDIRDLTPRELISVILTYISIEPLIANYCGNDRKSNFYCLPYAFSDTLTSAVTQMKESKSLNEFVSNCNGFEKYSSLNLRPVFGQGSIEFRMHEGTHDSTALLDWINILMCIRDYGQNNVRSDMPEMISGMGIREYIESIFGEYTDRLLFEGFEEAILNNVRIVQNILRMAQSTSIFRKRVASLAARYNKRGWTPPDALETYANSRGVSLINSPQINDVIQSSMNNNAKIYGESIGPRASRIRQQMERERLRGAGELNVAFAEQPIPEEEVDEQDLDEEPDPNWD